MKLLLWCSVIPLYLGLLTLPDGRQVESYEIFETKPRLVEGDQVYIKPKLNLSSCQLDFNSIPSYNPITTNTNVNATNSSSASTNRNYRYTTLAILPEVPCIDYLNLISDYKFITQQLTTRSYPTLATILFLTSKDLQLGAPTSNLNLNVAFQPQINITYQIVPTNQLNDLNFNSILVNPSLNPWTNLLNSNINFCWTVVFKVVKYILLIMQFILLAFVCARTKFKGQLQICLLLVGVLQLGGEMVISWSDSKQLTVKSFLTILLLPACIVNSLVVLSWCNIVWRLQTSVKIKGFKVAVIVESLTLCCAICIQIGLVVCQSLWIGQGHYWFEVLQIVSLLLMTILSVGMGVWFVKLAMNFCPIFHSTAKLINAQWLTLFILLTRIFFIVSLISTNLFLFKSETPTQYLAFSTVNNFSSIAYNTIIILIVIKMQSIKSQLHRWTPDQLGLVTLPDGTVVATTGTNSSSPNNDLTAVNSQVSMHNGDKKLNVNLNDKEFQTADTRISQSLEASRSPSGGVLGNATNLHHLQFFPPPPSIPIPPIPKTEINLRPSFEEELDAWGNRESGF